MSSGTRSPSSRRAAARESCSRWVPASAPSSSCCAGGETAMIWYALLVVAAAVERLIEVRVADRSRAVSKTHGGVELGAGHYPAMVALLFTLLVGCLVEPIVLRPSF